MIEKLSS